jgi:putative membrane protein
LRGRPGRIGQPPDPRFSFANERTFLAWNRTALALIGGGLAAFELLRLGVAGAGRYVGVPLILLGAAVGITGFARWHAAEVALRLRRPLPRSPLAPAVLAIGTAMIALLAIALLIYSETR